MTGSGSGTERGGLLTAEVFWDLLGGIFGAGGGWEEAGREGCWAASGIGLGLRVTRVAAGFATCISIPPQGVCQRIDAIF